MFVVSSGMKLSLSLFNVVPLVSLHVTFFYIFIMDTSLRMSAGPPKENVPYVKGILDFRLLVFMCMGDIFGMDICT